MKKKLNKYNKCISYCFYMKNIINNKIIEKKVGFELEKPNENMDTKFFL